MAAVKAIAPGFAGINLEDISAPRCFEVEKRLRDELDIPVFHDDQHGTAIVTLAALMNALKVVKKDMAAVRIVMAGAGAAGTAILKLLMGAGATDVVVCDRKGVATPDRADIAASPGSELAWVAEPHQPAPGQRLAARGRRRRGRLHRSLRSGHPRRRRHRPDGGRRDRLRHGQPRPRGRPQRGRSARGGRRDRTQ